jgi:hypothetical protein
MIFAAITTCNREQWSEYGRAMATTFVRHWSEEIGLTVYTEGFSGKPNGRVRFVDLDQAAPWLGPWKAERTPDQRGMTPNGYRYRWDAVKFSHKIAAIGAAVSLPCDVLIWLDADVVSHAPVTIDWLDSLFPADADVAWLDRERYYPECGFMMLRWPAAGEMISDLVATYRTGAIFRLQQWHDSFVIETIVKAAEARGTIKVASLSGAAKSCHHPLAAGAIGSRLDHLKGNRKTLGRSVEYVGKRPEPYWR